MKKNLLFLQLQSGGNPLMLMLSCKERSVMGITSIHYRLNIPRYNYGTYGGLLYGGGKRSLLSYLGA